MKKPQTLEQRRKQFVPRDVLSGGKPIRTSTNFLLGQSFDDYEHVNGISETVPDQSLSIEDILSRHKRGIPVRMHDPIYFDEEVPNLAKMDLTERDETIRSAQADVNSKKTALQQQASNAARRNTEPTKADPSATNPPKTDPGEVKP